MLGFASRVDLEAQSGELVPMIEARKRAGLNVPVLAILFVGGSEQHPRGCTVAAEGRGLVLWK